MAWSSVTPPTAGTPVSTSTFGTAVATDLAILGGAWTTDARATTAIWTTTSASVGNGSLVSRYRLVGKSLDWLVVLTFGSTTSAGSGQFVFAYPGVSALSAGAFAPVRLFDNSGPTTYMAGGILNTATVNLQSISSSAGVLSAVTAGAPFTWANNDVCAFLITGLETS